MHTAGMRRLLSPAALALTATLTLGAAACGSHHSALLIVGSSALKTADGKSARVETTADLPGATAGTRRTTKGSGIVDFTTGNGEFTVDAASLGIPGATSLQLDSVSSVFYIKGLSALTGGLKPWIKLDLATLAKTAGAQSLNLFDPTANLNQLQGVTGTVRVVGKEKVRGTQTTHYAFNVDLLKAARLVAADKRAALQSAASSVANHTVAVELWADSQGRARKITQTIQVASGTISGQTKLTQEFYDFGIKVSVTAPPPDQVLDASALFGGAGG